MYIVYTYSIMNTTINIRIDSKMKNSAAKIFDEMGLDISSAVKLFLTRAISTKSIPFPITTGRMHDPKFVALIRKETEWARKHGKKYTSVDKLFNDLNK